MPETFFHVIVKAVGNDVLFRNDENRHFFLQKYSVYSFGYWNTFSYTLMNNHVHWLIQTSRSEKLFNYLSSVPQEKLKVHQKRFLNNEISFEREIELQWKDFMICYAMNFNKYCNRSGHLFVNPFRRITVIDDAHFTQLVLYHHANVYKHLGQRQFQEYRWSSYQAILSDKPTLLKRQYVLDWFGGKERFISFHKENAKYYYDHPLAME
ncbi:MAG: hypothetical protein JST86_02235 [Bacteroidetes bacterium]|nr:hypothetical protein [Bacteroidota bacterium]